MVVRPLSSDLSRKADRKEDSFICIGAGVSQLPLIKTAKQMGYSVIAIDRNPDAPGFNHADYCINMSLDDIEGITNELSLYQEKYIFKGCVARVTGHSLYTASAMTGLFGLNGLSDGLILISTEKTQLKRFCLENQINTPLGMTLESIEIMEKLLPLFPLIIKPDNTKVGKSDIFLCKNIGDLNTFITTAIKSSSNSMALIESYITGIDATCLCHAKNGTSSIITWWDELVGIDSHNRIVGIGISVPSVIDGTVIQLKAEQIITRLVREFPAVNALLLISFRISMNGEPFIIEIHSDLGGDLIADALLPYANHKFNFFELAIKVSAGSIEKTECIKFEPSILYYSDKSPDYYIYQNGSTEKNLSVMQKIIDMRGLRLSVEPLHLDWLKLHADKKRR